MCKKGAEEDFSTFPKELRSQKPTLQKYKATPQVVKQSYWILWYSMKKDRIGWDGMKGGDWRI